VRLIECTLETLPELQQLSVKTFIDTYQHLNDPNDFNKYLEKAFSIDKLRSELSNPESFFYFLEDEDRNIGYIKINIGAAQTEAKALEYLEIERIYILKEAKGQGFGRYLMEKSMLIAKEFNKKKIWLGVFEKNPNAIDFYKHMGMQEAGTHTFTIGSDHQIDIVMEKKLE